MTEFTTECLVSRTFRTSLVMMAHLDNTVDLYSIHVFFLPCKYHMNTVIIQYHGISTGYQHCTTVSIILIIKRAGCRVVVLQATFYG